MTVIRLVSFRKKHVDGLIQSLTSRREPVEDIAPIRANPQATVCEKGNCQPGNCIYNHKKLLCFSLFGRENTL